MNIWIDPPPYVNASVLRSPPIVPGLLSSFCRMPPPVELKSETAERSTLADFTSTPASSLTKPVTTELWFWLAS